MVELIIIRQECQLLATLCKHCGYQVGKGKGDGNDVITVLSSFSSPLPLGVVEEVCPSRCPLGTDVKAGLSTQNITIDYVTKIDVECRLGLSTLLRNVHTVRCTDTCIS